MVQKMETLCTKLVVFLVTDLYETHVLSAISLNIIHLSKSFASQSQPIYWKVTENDIFHICICTNLLL